MFYNLSTWQCRLTTYWKRTARYWFIYCLRGLAAVRRWQHCNDETILAQTWSSSVVVPLSVCPHCGSLQQTNEQWTHVSMTLATISYCGPSWLQIYWHTHTQVIDGWEQPGGLHITCYSIQGTGNYFKRVHIGFRRLRKTFPVKATVSFVMSLAPPLLLICPSVSNSSSATRIFLKCYSGKF